MTATPVPVMLDRAGLSVAAPLAGFIEERVLPGLGIEPGGWWQGVAAIYDAFAPQNRALLGVRDALQAQIDARYQAGEPVDEAFLREIGYLVPEPVPFTIGTENVDAEVATMAGPQLVVPILNARFLLNAANARWGSLYDAFYGTDALPGMAVPGGYDSVRGRQVVAAAKAFLDEAVPLAAGSWADLHEAEPVLRDPAQLVGRKGASWLFVNHGLHIEVVVDRDHPIGREDRAGIADVILESALTTICDLEDSVAAVDAEDKVAAYANWLGLMKGDLAEAFEKGGKTVTRRLNPDRVYDDGLVLPGRSLLFVRNVGHLMTTPAIRLADGSDAPEGILDAIVTSTIALYDLRGLGTFRNSRAGSVYIVKPKMHGPTECSFTNAVFDAVEDLLGLTRHTIKVGVMDEERRTSANLAACI
ncbi:MAG: malate synthase G, partial [Pseudomonadota bacterium]